MLGSDFEALTAARLFGLLGQMQLKAQLWEWVGVASLFSLKTKTNKQKTQTRKLNQDQTKPNRESNKGF